MATLDVLTIGRFRNVQPGTTLRFRRGFNVLLGKNATGKTTLLNLIAAVISLDLSPFAKEPFDLTFELSSGESPLKVHVENVHQERPPGVAHPQGAQALPTPDSWLSGAEIELDEGSKRLATFTFKGGQVDLKIGDYQPDPFPLQWPLLGHNLLFPFFAAPDEKVSAGFAKGLPPGLVRRFAVARFDESLGLFDDIFSKARVQLALLPEAQPVALPFFAPAEVAAAIGATLKDNPDLATVRMQGLKLLDEVVGLLKFKTATLYAERLEKKAANQSAGAHAIYGSFRFEFERHDGSVISHKLLSYGQKRLLAFRYWLATFPGVVVADELVNGLHHEWIESCVEAIRDRQSFLTTQNPLLLDYLGFSPEQGGADTFISCSSATPEGGPERLQWANLPEEEVHDFHLAYAQGIQLVSEILISKGLW